MINFNNFKNAVDTISRERKKPLPDPLETIKKVKVIGCQYEENKPARTLFFWLYLSGQRVSEMLKTKKYSVTIKNTEHGENIIINSITLKNKNHPRRTIPIPLYGDEIYMSKYIEKWINSVKNDEDSIFNYNRYTVYKMLSKIQLTIPAVHPKTKEVISEYTFNLHPHYLRHCRASHMAMYYDYNITELMNFFGWASPSMPNAYIVYNWKIFAKKFGEALQNNKK